MTQRRTGTMYRRVLMLAMLVVAGTQIQPWTEEAPTRARDLRAPEVMELGGRTAEPHSLHEPAQHTGVDANARTRDRQDGAKRGGDNPDRGNSGGNSGGGGRDRGGRADKPPDFRVQVGALAPAGDVPPLDYTSFYPSHLQVRRGQTVQFDTVGGVHTVAFRPGGEDGRPPIVRRDEGPAGFALTEEAWQRSECGGPAQAACVLDEADDKLSAGLPVWDLTWRVEIDRPAGTTITYYCSFHPGMNASIEVVDDDEPLPTQEEIDAEVRSQVALDTQEAIDHIAVLEGEVARREEGGRTVWTVLVGPSTPSGNAGILGYVPKRLEGARPGDAVEFVSSGPSGHHTVTFPSVLVGDDEISPGNRLTFAAIHPACDVDDRTRGAPGIGGPYEPITPLPCPGSLEFLPSPYVAKPHPAPGNVVATPATYHDSGLMWSEEAPESARGRPAGSGEYFLHRFVAEFPSAGGFQYACTIHGADFMAGTIQVDGSP